MNASLHAVWNAVMTASWRSIPVTVLLVAGVAMLLWGLREFFKPIGPVWMRGFRRAVIGIGFVGVGLGWLWQQPWLVALGLIFGGEETFESSWILAYWNEPVRQPTTH
jgi:hypothetical protein